MLIVAVKNTSGSTISAGQVVYQADYLRPQQLPIVALASAAAISTAEVLGICVWDIADNETGPIAVSGDVYPIDTSAFSAINDKVYLSDTLGAISATSGTVPAILGTVKVVGAAGTINTTGTINLPTFMVTAITPPSGPIAGSTAVTITGAGFVSVTDVTIGGTSCTSIVTVDANTITAVTPAGSAGAQDVVVTTSAGSKTLTGGFTYVVAAPTVTSITPNSGDYLGGTAVTIAGTDFLTSPGVPGALAVTIGGTTCTTIVYVSAISITAVSPAGSAGAQDVVVTTNYGTGTLVGGFTYTTGPFNVYSMLFDGVSEYCESNSAASTTSGQPYSISLWSKNTPGGSGWQSLIATGSPALDISQAMLFRYNGTSLYMQGPWGYFYGGSLSNTEWNHIVFTHAGTAGSHLLTWYIDGAATLTMTGSASLLDEAWNMGRLWNYTASWTYGINYIDEVSFFRGVALSLAEVQEIYNVGEPANLTTHSRYTDLRSWWRMGDKMSGTTLPDQGPASNDLIAYNSPTLSTDIPTNEPSITSITPAGGLVGTAVTIAGSKFIDAVGAPGFVSVTIGGVTCTSIVAVSTASITAVAPAGTLGSYEDVVVTTVFGTATLSSGFYYTFDFRSMYFDGVDDNISTSGAWPELSSSGSGYSVSFWLKLPNGSGPVWNYVFSLSDSSGKWRMYGAFLYAEGDFRLYEGNADTLSFASSSTSVDRMVEDKFWHHIACTSTGTGSTNGLKIYVDGVFRSQVTGKALGSNLASTKLFLANNHTPGYLIDANIDEFAIFGAELGYSAVTALYNSGAPTDLSAHADIQHWWRMGDGLDTASIIYDQEGSWDLDTPVNYPVLQTDTPLLIATQVEPYYGLSTGSTAITISGYNFDYVSSNGVTIGGSPCTSIVVGSTTITAVTPSGSAGAQDLVITSGPNSLTCTDGFVYVTSVPAWANASSVGFDSTNALRSSEAWPELSSSGSGYSVSFWLKLPNGTSGWPTWNYVFSLSDSSGKSRMYGTFVYAEGDFRLYEGNADTLSFASSLAFVDRMVEDKFWHHIAFTSTGTGSTNGLKIYVDGVFRNQVTGKALGSNLASTKLFLASNHTVTSLIDANIDEFAIFGAELSAGQVTALYNSGIPTDITAHAGIQHYYRMGDSIGDTAISIRDQVGGLDLDLPYGTPVLNADVPYLIVTQVDPYYGDIAGSTAITITGSNLANVSAITVDGNPCTSIVTAASSVTADTPAGSVGVVDIVITDSTNTNEVTCTDGFVYVTSVPAWANASSVEFDRTNALRSSEAWPELSSSGSGYSVSFWLKLPNGTSGWPVFSYVFSLSDSSGKSRMYGTFVYATGNFRLYEGNADTLSFASSLTSVNRMVEDKFWHHIAFTSTGTGSTNGLKIYVDGVFRNQVTGKALGSNLASTKLFLASNHTVANLIDANIDEFAIFGAELSAGQVTALYNSGIPTDITAHAGIQHYYRMGDSIGDTAISIRDQVGGLDLDLPYGTPVLNADVPYLIVTQVDPYYGDIAGSTAITITGSNLANVSAITVDGNPCTSIVTAASSVTADTPAGSVGVVDIVITDSTNTNEVTLTNRFIYRTGSVPAWSNTYSVEFDRTNALRSSEAWPELSSSGSGYSVSFWLKLPNGTSGWPVFNNVFSLSDSSGKWRMYGAFVFATGDFRLYEGNADTLSFASSTVYTAFVVDTLWHHIAFTSTGTGSTNGLKIYFDGAFLQQGTGKALGSNLASTKLFLASTHTLANLIDANIDEFAIFGAELSAGQVTALYNSGIPTDITAHAGIQHYYRMGDSIGDTAISIRDQVGGLDLDLPYGTPVIDADVP